MQKKVELMTINDLVAIENNNYVRDELLMNEQLMSIIGISCKTPNFEGWGFFITQ